MNVIMTEQEADILMSHCEERFKKYSNPCKSCSYRSKSDSNPYQTCMFSNCPRSWNEYKYDNSKNIEWLKPRR